MPAPPFFRVIVVCNQITKTPVKGVGVATLGYFQAINAQKPADPYVLEASPGLKM